MKLIESADAIVYDALANRDLLPADAKETGHPELYNVGKRGGDARSVTQAEINELIVRLAREGKRVVRLKGGDPFVFGRGSEEAQALNDASVPFEVVPGVTAGIAATAYAGIPVTHRGLSTSVTFVTGHEDPVKATAQTDWKALAKAGGTIVLYMGVKTLPSIAAALIEGGMPAVIPAAAIQWGTLSKQRTVTATLATLADEAAANGITAPVITVIGWPVILRDEISWFENRPLFGRKIVVTRAALQSQSLVEKLGELGADVIEMPATRIARLDLSPLRAAISHLDQYQWLIFTSQNAVSIFWEQLLGGGRDARALAGLAIAAVGPTTAAALLERGIAVDVIPSRFVAEGLLEKLGERDDVASARVLYVTAEGSREVLREGLESLGASLDVIHAYRSIQDGSGAARLKKELESGSVSAVTFTSASAVRGYVDVVGEELAQKAPAVTIGPQTTEAVNASGIELLGEAEESTTDGLVAAVERAFA
jgi:uroporphyrinogen III methyltransferase/synthase